MPNDNETFDSTNETETTENEELDLDLSDDNSEDVDIEDLKKQNATLKAQKEHWKKKATEKPPVKAITETPKPEKTDETGLSPKDTLALFEAKVSSEDFDEVVRISKILNKDITDTLKDKTVISILRERREERNTSMATQTKSPRGTTKPVGETLLQNASRGQVPTDESDIEALARARMESKFKK